MTDRVKNVAVLGSTGSIGQSTLAVIGASAGKLKAVALSAHARTGILARQAAEVAPRWVVATDAAGAERQDWSTLPAATELRIGHSALEDVVCQPEVDVVVAAIVGQRRPAQHVGGARGGQDRGLGQQRNARDGRLAGHGPGYAARGPDPAGR